jgi:hypothetical protein
LSRSPIIIGGGLCLKSTALSAELILGMDILVLNIKALYIK